MDEIIDQSAALAEIADLLTQQIKNQQQIVSYLYTLLSYVIPAIILVLLAIVVYIVLKPIMIFWKGGWI